MVSGRSLLFLFRGSLDRSACNAFCFRSGLAGGFTLVAHSELLVLSVWSCIYFLVLRSARISLRATALAGADFGFGCKDGFLAIELSSLHIGPPYGLGN